MTALWEPLTGQPDASHLDQLSDEIQTRQDAGDAIDLPAISEVMTRRGRDIEARADHSPRQDDPDAPELDVDVLANIAASAYWYEMTWIQLSGPATFEHAVSTREWVENLEGHLWHEMGHYLHSDELPVADETGPRARALQLLEDLRVERRLVDWFGAEARYWLRLNVLRGCPSHSIIIERAEMHGANEAATVWAGRTLSGVLTGAEAQRILQVLGDSGYVVDLQPLRLAWSSYVDLADDQLDGSDYEQAVDTTAGLLPPSATVP